MITRVDDLLDRITMYRLVLYVLIGLILLAEVLSFFHLLPFSPFSLLISTVFLVLVCWAAILAISSKYILSINNKHIFNPAAIAVVITSFATGYSASWWVGTASMLPAVLLAGVLLVRKLRQSEMVLLFIAASLVTVCIISLLQGLSVTKELRLLLVESPIFFFAAIMLTEPLTAPPTQKLKNIYGVMIGILFIPQIHIGPVYSTPELALITGNIYSYIVSPKLKVALKLRRKSNIASDIVDFVLKPSQRLLFYSCLIANRGKSAPGCTILRKWQQFQEGFVYY